MTIYKAESSKVTEVLRVKLRVFAFKSSKTHIYILGFPGASDDKESTCNVGDLGLILEEMATHSSIPAWKIPWT